MATLLSQESAPMATMFQELFTVYKQVAHTAGESEEKIRARERIAMLLKTRITQEPGFDSRPILSMLLHALNDCAVQVEDHLHDYQDILPDCKEHVLLSDFLDALSVCNIYNHKNKNK